MIESGGFVFPFEIKLSKNPRNGMLLQIENLKKVFPHIKWQQSNLVSLVENSFKLTPESKAINLKEYIELLQSLS
jgi:hypothetical protein